MVDVSGVKWGLRGCFKMEAQEAGYLSLTSAQHKDIVLWGNFIHD